MTLSQAKNAMQRAIDDLIDPPLSRSEKDLVWEHFEWRCAYCGRRLEKASREGHIDHVIPRVDGGTNQLGNCVLACRECNGDEKRDRPWAEFLELKCKDRETLARRAQRILAWHRQPQSRKRLLLSPEAAGAKGSAENAIAEFEQRFLELRKSVR